MHKERHAIGVAAERLAETAHSFGIFTSAQRQKSIGQLVKTLCVADSMYINVFGGATKHTSDMKHWALGDVWIVQGGVDGAGNAQEFLGRDLYLTENDIRLEVVPREPEDVPMVACEDMQTRQTYNQEAFYVNRKSGSVTMLTGASARSGYGALVFEDAIHLNFGITLPRHQALARMNMILGAIVEANEILEEVMQDRSERIIDLQSSFLPD